MNYYAITINNQDLTQKYNSITKVYQEYSKMPITVYCIAVERNEINVNTHYHLLIGLEFPITHLDNQYTWWKQIDNDVEVLKYFNYIKKGGNYKIYNNLEINNNVVENTIYNEMLIACKTFNNITDLITANPHFIKHIHKLTLLWSIIHKN